jgi:6-phosphogluconolactonase (cycloisomerase 2 family)
MTSTADTWISATNENYDGRVQSFTINSNGGLTAVSTVASGGDGPTHLLPLSTGQIAVMNVNATYLLFELRYTNLMVIISITRVPLVSFRPRGMDHRLQDLPRLSSSVETLRILIRRMSIMASSLSPTWYVKGCLVGFLEFSADIDTQGADTIWRLKVSGSSMALTGSISQPSGSGPRHMQISGGQLFVLHELSSTLTVQPLPASPSGSSSITSTVNIIPPGVPSGNTYAAGELLIPPTSSAFPTTYIYASNRNTGYNRDPRGGDAITIIQVSGGQLSIVGYVYTGLDQIRGMQFGGPDKRYLITGSASGAAGVAVFERTDGGKTLTLVARDTTIPIRTTFAWLE